MNQSGLLIVGASGQLGSALRAYYPQAAAVDSQQLDISNAEQVKHFNWSSVRVIINAAAYTNVDGAETTEGRMAAWHINAAGSANLAQASIEHNLILVHISSDYVFDGTQNMHTEDEPFSPLGVYGQTKAAGDIAVSLAAKHYILRTSWVIGDGKNFVKSMLGLGQKGIAPTVVSDQIGRLTFTSVLVKAIDHLLISESAYGTYNVTNSGEPASWADITREIFNQAGYELTVTDTTTAAYYASKSDIAPRPLRSVLSLDKIQATGFISIDWRNDLTNYISKETVS